MRPVARRSGGRVVGALCALCVAATAATAQPVLRLPDHAPLNPTVAARSALGAYAYRDATAGWSIDFAFDYGSATELDEVGSASYVLDAELVRARVTVARDVGGAKFVLLEGGVMAAHAGFADGFFDSFHRLIRYDQWSRANRPRNAFAYEIVLPSGDTTQWRSAPPALDDVTLGLGRRHSRYVQSLALVTLPVSTTAAGYRRGVPTVGLVNTARAPVGERAAVELSLGVGAAPRHGSLARVQRIWFASSSAGLRLHAWRALSVYGLLFYHSPLYVEIGLPELDRGQLTVDFGFLVDAGGRDWRVGLVEDTRATDGGIDLVLRLGTSRAGR